MSRFVLVVAGGTGTRMRSTTAKQFILVKGLPLMWWTLRRFRDTVPDAEVSIVLHESLFEEFRRLEDQYGKTGAKHLISGGAERFHSVLNGLSTLPDEGLVAIHDAVRAFPSSQTIKNGFELAAIHGSAIPVVPIKDSLRNVTGATSQSVPRDQFRSVQTPQFFDLALIKPAFSVDFDERFTDDASVFESSGHQIKLFPGNPMNMKVTTPEDLLIAEAFCDIT